MNILLIENEENINEFQGKDILEHEVLFIDDTTQFNEPEDVAIRIRNHYVHYDLFIIPIGLK